MKHGRLNWLKNGKETYRERAVRMARFLAVLTLLVILIGLSICEACSSTTLVFWAFCALVSIGSLLRSR